MIIYSCPPGVREQVVTQMAAAMTNFAILTCLKGTIFFFRDPKKPSVVYCTRSYQNDTPLLLYYTAFLAMAAKPELLGDHLPKPANLDSLLTTIRWQHFRNPGLQHVSFINTSMTPADDGHSDDQEG
jgi:hypothetical protein